MVVRAIIDSTEFAGISNFYGFAVTKGAPIGRCFTYSPLVIVKHARLVQQIKHPNAWCCIVISHKSCLMQWLTSACASILISSLHHCLYVLHISGTQPQKNGNGKVLTSCLHASLLAYISFQLFATTYHLIFYFSLFSLHFQVGYTSG